MKKVKLYDVNKCNKYVKQKMIINYNENIKNKKINQKHYIHK